MNKRYVKELAKTITEIKDTKTAEDFLHNILTPTELEEISKRLQIVIMLSKGIPQRKIAQKLSVAVATVGRGSREMKYGKPGFKKILAKK
jgi:TrpR family trp operon transcriptional repressor